jgi:hypothetical protein
MEFDLEHQVHFFQGQAFCFHVEEPNDRKPCEVQNCEDDVEPPANVGDCYFYISGLFSGVVMPKLTTRGHENHNVDKYPVGYHGHTVAEIAHARGVDLGRIEEWYTQERQSLSIVSYFFRLRSGVQGETHIE